MFGIYVNGELLFSDDIKDVVDNRARRLCYAIYHSRNSNINVVESKDIISYFVTHNSRRKLLMELRPC